MKIQLGKHELDERSILANDVIFPHEYNPNDVRLWVIGHEYGPVAAVWADCEQAALDLLIDSGLGDCFLVDDESDIDEDTARLGNAGAPCNLNYTWIDPVDLSKLPLPVLLAFAEARGAGNDTLYG